MGTFEQARTSLQVVIDHYRNVKFVVHPNEAVAGTEHDPEMQQAIDFLDLNPPAPPAPPAPSAMEPQEQVKRLTADWSRYAKEQVVVELIAGAAYGFGSEVACLRLYAVYRMPLKTRVAFSTNREQWFFTLELS